MKWLVLSILLLVTVDCLPQRAAKKEKKADATNQKVLYSPDWCATFNIDAECKFECEEVPKSDHKECINGCLLSNPCK